MPKPPVVTLSELAAANTWREPQPQLSPLISTAASSVGKYKFVDSSSGGKSRVALYKWTLVYYKS